MNINVGDVWQVNLNYVPSRKRWTDEKGNKFEEPESDYARRCTDVRLRLDYEGPAYIASVTPGMKDKPQLVIFFVKNGLPHCVAQFDASVLVTRLGKGEIKLNVS